MYLTHYNHHYTSHQEKPLIFTRSFCAEQALGRQLPATSQAVRFAPALIGTTLAERFDVTFYPRRSLGSNYA